MRLEHLKWLAETDVSVDWEKDHREEDYERLAEQVESAYILIPELEKVYTTLEDGESNETRDMLLFHIEEALYSSYHLLELNRRLQGMRELIG